MRVGTTDTEGAFFRACLALAFVTALSGCGSDKVEIDEDMGYSSEKTYSPSEFGEIVASRVSGISDVVGCGEVDLRTESTLEANTCIAQSFSESRDAYVLYSAQGVDSVRATGVTVVEGVVTVYEYDQQSVGPDQNNGIITSYQCFDAKLSGVVDQLVQNVFFCEEGPEQS